MTTAYRTALLLTLLTLCCCRCRAQQRQKVVIDAETNVPVRDVQVYMNATDGQRLTTDYRGCVILPDTARSITLCHPKYEELQTNLSETTDTILLLPNLRRLNELVVIGHRPQISPDMMKMPEPIAGPTPKGASVSFDFFSLFTWKKRKKQKERMKAIEDY